MDMTTAAPMTQPDAMEVSIEVGSFGSNVMDTLSVDIGTKPGFDELPADRAHASSDCGGTGIRSWLLHLHSHRVHITPITHL